MLTSSTPRMPIPLPCTSTRSSYPYAHVKLLTRIGRMELAGAAFEGRILPPGKNLPAEELGKNPVALECAGPVGQPRIGRRRPVLWILWRYDWDASQWKEIARSTAVGWEWSLVLYEPAVRLLYPKPEQVDAVSRGRDLANALIDAIDERILHEAEPVKFAALTSVYDQVAGRIAAQSVGMPRRMTAVA